MKQKILSTKGKSFVFRKKRGCYARAAYLVFVCYSTLCVLILVKKYVGRSASAGTPQEA
jgi:hypothetical protein